MGEQDSAGQAMAPAAKLEIGSVLSRSFGVVRRNLMSLGAVTLLNVFFQGITFHLFLGDLMNAAEGEAADGMSGLPDSGSALLYWLLALAFSAFLMAIVTYGTVQDLRGRPEGLGQWLRYGLNVILPAIVLMLVWYVIITLGIILLIVPGVILLLMLWVVFPVMVMERPGIVASLRRSAFLTKGNRWRLLGMTLLMAAIMGAVFWVITSALPFAGPGSALYNAISAVFGIYWLVVLGVTYYDLRMAKDGIDIGRAAAVFD